MSEITIRNFEKPVPKPISSAPKPAGGDEAGDDMQRERVRVPEKKDVQKEMGTPIKKRRKDYER